MQYFQYQSSRLHGSRKASILNQPSALKKLMSYVEEDTLNEAALNVYDSFGTNVPERRFAKKRRSNRASGRGSKKEKHTSNHGRILKQDARPAERNSAPGIGSHKFHASGIVSNQMSALHATGISVASSRADFFRTML